jgi:co-chaperonin GroES (HSP10)
MEKTDFKKLQNDAKNLIERQQQEQINEEIFTVYKNYIPQQDFVLVVRLMSEAQVGSIIVPEGARALTQEAIILKISTLALEKNRELAEGQRVIIAKYSGFQVSDAVYAVRAADVLIRIDKADVHESEIGPYFGNIQEKE